MPGPFRFCIDTIVFREQALWLLSPGATWLITDGETIRVSATPRVPVALHLPRHCHISFLGFYWHLQYFSQKAGCRFTICTVSQLVQVYINSTFHNLWWLKCCAYEMLAAFEAAIQMQEIDVSMMRGIFLSIIISTCPWCCKCYRYLHW